VQEHALSQVFDEVRTRMRNARMGTNSATHRLQLTMNQTMRNTGARVDTLTFKLSPARLQTRLANLNMRLESASNGCTGLMDTHLEVARNRLGLAATSLDALSPLAVLQRGYAIAQDKAGHLLRDAQSLSMGDPVTVRLAKGRFDARVERTEEE
jgi:exodeoxyribonuclease VII large subunit